MITHKYELINKENNNLSLSINMLIEHASCEEFDIYDHVALAFIDNQFKGKYSVYNKIRERVLNYLIENEIVEILDQKIYNDTVTVYQIKLLQKRTLELL